MRRALLSFEAYHVQDPQFSKISKDAVESDSGMAKLETSDIVPRPDWEKYCSQVAEKVMSEQSPDRLYQVRQMLYELLVHCIPANVVISVSPAAALGSTHTR